MDPPQHTRQRTFVNRGFTPRMAGQLEKRVRQVCDALIGADDPEYRASPQDGMWAAEAIRLRSNFINGIKRMPVRMS